jgi:hydrogenase maturation protein HypF
MFPLGDDDPLAYLRQEVSVRAEEAALVLSVQRPIVLASRREDSRLPESIAPGLTEVGVFLPYSPLHDLLLGELKRPVVATSGNLSGEPVLTDNADATERLSHIADAFLHHDRPIVRPADDAVYRRVRGKPRPIRLGRGTAPLELTLNRSLQRPVLAVGGHLKNTVALGWENRLVVSPHIGDMGSPRSLAVFEDLVADLPGLYGVSVAEMVCDAHPDYHTARWAKRQQLPLHEVWHHHAHASAAVGWEDPEGDYLVFTWDGVGFGVDGTLWGGEALWGNAGRWQRVGRLKPFRLPGGDQAARQPWRSAASLCWEAAYPVPSDLNVDPLLRAAWEKGVNCPQTSAAGRLFDAATALVGVATEASFEGQAPMRLEATSTASSNYPELPCSQTDSGLWEIDWTPLLPYLTDVTRPVGERAAGFHQAMATALAAQAVHVRSGRPVDAVALSGGVFQNRLLTESAAEKLEASGFEMRFSEAIPVNDAGISAGQILEYAGSPANR